MPCERNKEILNFIRNSKRIIKHRTSKLQQIQHARARSEMTCILAEPTTHHPEAPEMFAVKISMTLPFLLYVRKRISKHSYVTTLYKEDTMYNVYNKGMFTQMAYTLIKIQN